MGAARGERPKSFQGVWGGQAQVAPACGCLENGVCGVVNRWLLGSGGGGGAAVQPLLMCQLHKQASR